MGGREGLRDLDDLALGLLGAEVDRGADGDRAHVAGLLDLREHDLVVAVRIGQELVVVELDDERDVVRVLARDGAEHAQRRGHRVAAALDRELDDAVGIEVVGVLRERRARRVLDALVDRAGSRRSRCPPRRPLPNRLWSERSTGAERSLSLTTRSTKSGPGRWRRSRAIVVHSWPRRSSASSPRIDSMRSMPLAELVMAMSAGYLHPAFRVRAATSAGGSPRRAMSSRGAGQS